METTRVFRLNQAIAKAGVCSRREADKLIAAGRVRLNGITVTDFATAVNAATDTLEIDGKQVRLKEFVNIVMYKPRGIVTTCADEYGRESVLDLLPSHLHHLRPVGRLDKESEGLLILSNDGDLTQKLTHPVHHMAKTYLVTVKGLVQHDDLKRLSKGLMLSDGPTLPAQARLIKRDGGLTTFELSIREGRNRQIRRMCAHLGYQVIRLVRVGIGELQLGQMAPGSWRYLMKGEMSKLES
jgi:pseudouridine synthase